MKLTLTTLSLLCCMAAFGQTKIGNITIADSVASKYLMYLYQHPDTVQLKDKWQDYPVMSRSSYSVVYMPMSYEQQLSYEQPIRDYNANVINNSIGKAYKTVDYPAGIDTVRKDGNYFTNSVDWHKDYKIHPDKYKTKAHDAAKYSVEIGYLVSKHPTEQGFIKWFSTIYKK